MFRSLLLKGDLTYAGGVCLFGNHLCILRGTTALLKLKNAHTVFNGTGLGPALGCQREIGHEDGVERLSI